MGVRLDLEPQEALALRNLLNVACMAKGLEVAEACLVLDAKILAAGREFEAASARKPRRAKAST